MRTSTDWRALLAALTITAAAAAVPSGALATTHHPAPKKHAKKHQTNIDSSSLPGLWPKNQVQTLHLNFGPFRVAPGQNNIKFDVVNQRPQVDGWITSFVPNLVYSKGGVCPAIVKESDVPPVDVIHLHHGVWVVNGNPAFAAGEEKTRLYEPKGFAQPYHLSDKWLITYMIHNLTPQAATVCLTYDVGFIPQTSKYAKGIIPVRTQWMDVVGGIWPVFNVHEGSGTNGTFTYPDQQPNAPKSYANDWRVPQDETIVAMAGHLHPGGLYNTLYDTRVINGVPKTVMLFRSRAHYFEPAGAVSWDVAIMGTPPNYRVKVKAGDVIHLNVTYDSSHASWYEAMGIMGVQITNDDEGGVDPFTHNVAVAGVLNHGHLAENDHHGGNGPKIGPLASSLPSGPLTDAGTVPITNFIYGQGDLTLGGAKGNPPTVHQGQSLTFVNNDYNVGPGEWHTITSCKSPCNAQTGIAYPLANGPVEFDSGELGVGGPPTANRTTWSTPASLPPGTYNYFCRIHPFMRGSFRVLPAQ